MTEQLAVPLAVPTAQTAQRPQWTDLPAAVRSWVERRLGATVTESRSQRSGYTPGFASRVLLADGRRAFVKIMGWGREALVQSYRNEAIRRRLLPDGVAAPALLDHAETRIDDQDWVLLIFADIAGRPPHRPWTAEQARVAIATVERNAALLSPAPAGYDWMAITDELGGLSPDKEDAIDALFGDHRAELRELVEAFGERCSGDALVHADLRDDNMLIDDHGGGWVCDWSFPVLGRAYLDLVSLVLSMHGDGLDGDTLLAGSRLVGPGDADGVDSFLADLMLYYLISGARPDVEGSPYLRRHQRWSGAVAARWLSARRGWGPSAALHIAAR